jgi:hypothetical protein
VASPAARDAAAAPRVFFDPAPVMVDPGEEFELSFRVNDCGDSVASYQLYMSFDYELIELLEATEGTLYAESGLMTWFIEEEQEPGFWHFFDTVFGVGTYVLPPGELLHLRFRALPDVSGYTQAHIDTIRMTDIRRDPLPIEDFQHADIFVADTGVPGGPQALSIGPAIPNPFAGQTGIAFSAPVGDFPCHAEVYDLSGRLVRKLEVPPSHGRGSLVWDGRTATGVAASSAVYFVMLSGGGVAAQTKIVKLN